MLLKWTKTSSPSGETMNPNPFFESNHLTGPRGMTVLPKRETSDADARERARQRVPGRAGGRRRESSRGAIGEMTRARLACPARQRGSLGDPMYNAGAVRNSSKNKQGIRLDTSFVGFFPCARRA